MIRTLSLVAVLSTAVHAEELAQVGQPAPTFRLPVYNAEGFGESFVALDRYVGPSRVEPSGKVLVVSFMASFCGPCKKEMPWLQRLHEENRERGLRVMMVAIDAEEEGQKKISELIAQHQVTFPVAKDRFNIVARRWLGPQSPLPSVFLVRPDGTVSSVHRGYSDDGAELLASALDGVLGVAVSRPVVEAPPVVAPPVESQPKTKKKK